MCVQGCITTKLKVKCVTSGTFPNSWRNANVQPVQKKNDRQLISNYRPISFLPICGKIPEKIVFDQVYSFLNVNNLLSKFQSGFRPGDSCIYQLIPITSSIYESFENYDETRAIFLHISKAFDKVWHDRLTYKLKCNGISGSLLDFFTNYLSNRKQRVVLNGIAPDWRQKKSRSSSGICFGAFTFPGLYQ